MGIHEMWSEFVMGKFTREQFYLCGNISDMLFSTFMLQPILGVHCCKYCWLEAPRILGLSSVFQSWNA